jgi:nucleotide-binding universal stress UspA family protein
MKRVIAALDNSIAAKPVLTAALALGELLDAEVTPVHVALDGARVAAGVAEGAGLPLHVVRGPVVEAILDEGGADDVVAVVLGARGTPSDPRPLGQTAFAVSTLLPVPVVMVPPDGVPAPSFRRVLVPLEGDLSKAPAPRAIVEVAAGHKLDVVVLHVIEAASLPLFTDQPQHEQPAWAEEFLRRYCPWGIGAVRLEVRVGKGNVVVPQVAEDTRADLIVLGWAQEFAEGRAPVVRASLERGRVPVMLLPVHVRVLVA